MRNFTLCFLSLFIVLPIVGDRMGEKYVFPWEPHGTRRGAVLSIYNIPIGTLILMISFALNILIVIAVTGF